MFSAIAAEFCQPDIVHSLGALRHQAGHRLVVARDHDLFALRHPFEEFPNRVLASNAVTLVIAILSINQSLNQSNAATFADLKARAPPSLEGVASPR